MWIAHGYAVDLVVFFFVLKNRSFFEADTDLNLIRGDVLNQITRISLGYKTFPLTVFIGGTLAFSASIKN